MAKIKRSVSMILSVLMAASVLTTAPVSAATVEASDAGANVAETQQAELKIAEGSCGDKLTWTLDNDGVLEISGEGKMYDFDFEAKEGENSFNPWTLYREQIKKVVVKDGVEYIGNFAFFGFAELEEAQISDSVKEIGENAFEGCEKLDAEAFTEPTTEEETTEAVVEETTKNSPIVVKEEEEAVGAAAEEEAVGVGISKCTITLSKTSYTYNGKANTPSVTVKYGSITLINGINYTVDYKNNINAGTATVTVIGKGIFTGSVTKSFTISKTAISSATLKLSGLDCIYDGTEKKPTVTATYNSIELVNGTDFTVSYKNNKNVGNATVTITGAGTNFTGTTTRTFTIQKRSIKNCTVTIDDSDCTYTGKSVYPKITVKDGDKTLQIGSDFGPIYSNIIDAGTSVLKLQGVGNYGDIVETSFTIKPKSITGVTVTPEYTTVNYDGKAKEPTATVFDGTKELISGTDFTCSYTNNIAAGIATMNVDGIGNYTGQSFVTFEIIPKSLDDCKITLPSDSYVYSGSNYPCQPHPTITDGNTVLKLNTDYRISHTKLFEGGVFNDAGQYQVTITGIGNYEGTVFKPYEILKLPASGLNIYVNENPSYNYNYRRTFKHITTNVSKSNYDVKYSFNDDNTITASITGKKNCTGTVDFTYNPISQTSFVWGRDNWSFNNSGNNFSNGYKVSDSVLNPLAEELSFTLDEISDISSYYTKRSGWKGSCYGMSLSSILSAQGYLDLGKYTNSSNINEVTADENSTSVINCFQASYCYADISYLIREATKCGKSLSYVESTNPAQPEYIKAFENEFAKDSTPLLVVFRMEGKKNYIANHTYETMSHAVVAYGIDDCQYNHTFDNKVTKTYDKRILIYDPNGGAKNAITNNNCIYYNSSDYSWVCPAWTGTYNCYWDGYMGTSIKTGSISSITKIHSISVAENVLNHVSYDYLTRKYPSSVGADEGINDNIDFKWATLDDLVENENALSVSTKGDVNGDGSVDVSDANAIQMYLAGITELSDAQLSAADANNDGVVSVDDSLYIQLMLAELV